ncbi:hypothetical protein RJ641_004824 [Dillenia turbinata]|uniref:Uncharacterized protein n=1 Tax=Dillenia turbinata TaxID=194707 RepID=A0AAN8Z6R6_9MAGN
MLDSDPNQPGFFIKTSEKSPYYKPIDEKPDILVFLKRGILVEPENPNPNHDLAEKSAKPLDANMENLLPNFDFDYTIGRKLSSSSGTRSTVLMVVDASNFDGFFPKRVAKLVSTSIDESYASWKQGNFGNVPRAVHVVTITDLLEHWVRQEAREGGANKLTSIYLGNVWAIDAQNAGKLTLVNSIRKHVGGNITHLTEALVPDTTLGIVSVKGLLPGQAKLFYTSGLLHPHQITTRLMMEEQKLVYINKELKPRTYRIKFTLKG